MAVKDEDLVKVDGIYACQCLCGFGRFLESSVG